MKLTIIKEPTFVGPMANTRLGIVTCVFAACTLLIRVVKVASQSNVLPAVFIEKSSHRRSWQNECNLS